MNSSPHFTCKLYMSSFTRFLVLVLEPGVSVTMIPDLPTHPHTPFLPSPTSLPPLSCPLSKVTSNSDHNESLVFYKF